MNISFNQNSSFLTEVQNQLVNYTVTNPDHALFRNPSDLDQNPLLETSFYPIPDPNYYDDEDIPVSGGGIIPGFIEPLLPPHINYDKVNKYGQLPNDTYFFQTFYFHPSFNNILLLMGLISFTMWVLVMNILTIIGLWRTHRKGHMADLYLANLAFGDSLLGILVLPLMSVVILLGYFPFDKFVCDMWVFLDYYLIVAASFGSCALMCNYLWMIKWPSSFPVDAKHHILAVAFCWVAVNLSWTPSFFNDRLSTYYPQGQCGFSISRNQYFSFYIGMSGFYIPLAVSLICGIWSLTGLKKKSGIPLLSWKQSLSIGRRKRSSRFVNEVIWTFFKILPETIIDSLEVDIEGDNGKPKSKFSKLKSDRNPPGRYYGPGANSKRPYLKHLKQKQHSITSANDPKMISQIAKDHYPLVVSSLVLFIICRSLFYVYFGVGSFVPNFFPLDLSNGVYWLMHSNAAISPLIHFAFDPELREEVINMLGIRRNPQRSPIVRPEPISKSRLQKSYSKESRTSTSNLDDDGVGEANGVNPTVASISINESQGSRSVRSLEHFLYPSEARKPHQILDFHRSPPENPNGIRL